MTPIEKACEYLITRAYPAYDKKTCGNCASFVRSAVDYATGKHIEKKASAKDYGSSYEKIGFKKVFSYPEQDKNNYQPVVGDICIIHYEPHGHICMLTKEGWISDFKQTTGGSKLPLAAMYGGKIRDKNPPFNIYRYG